MTRRYRPTATPGPRGDWRALADCPQRLPELSADDEHNVELRLRHNGRDVPVVVLVAAVTITNPAELRTLATRLHAAADALEVAR